MSITTPVLSDTAPSAQPDGGKGGIIDRVYNFLKSIPTWVLWIIVVVWSIPTLGLFVNSFRDRDAQRATGWWKLRPSELTIENYQRSSSLVPASAGRC